MINPYFEKIYNHEMFLLGQYFFKIIFPIMIIWNVRGKKILERLGSTRIFCKSNFSALFSVRNRLEKSAKIFDLQNIRADPSHFDIVFPLLIRFTVVSKWYSSETFHLKNQLHKSKFEGVWITADSSYPLIRSNLNSLHAGLSY